MKYKLIKQYPNSPALGIEWEHGSLGCAARGFDLTKYPEFWQEIKEEPKVFYGINVKTWVTYHGDKNFKELIYGEYEWFDTQKERDCFILENKPQFNGIDMKSFAEQYKNDSFDLDTSLSNWLYTKQNGTN